MDKAVQWGFQHTVVYCDTLVCAGSKVRRCIWHACLQSAGQALRLWENRSVRSYLAWPMRHMCVAPTAHCIGGCGHWQLACRYILIMTRAHVHTQAIPNTDRHPRTLWWIHSQNSLELNQLHVLCRLYAVWFGIANRLETWHVTSGKSGSHQPYVCKPNWDMSDRMRYSLQAPKQGRKF